MIFISSRGRGGGKHSEIMPHRSHPNFLICPFIEKLITLFIEQRLHIAQILCCQEVVTFLDSTLLHKMCNYFLDTQYITLCKRPNYKINKQNDRRITILTIKKKCLKCMFKSAPFKIVSGSRRFGHIVHKYKYRNLKNILFVGINKKYLSVLLAKFFQYFSICCRSNCRIVWNYCIVQK